MIRRYLSPVVGIVLAIVAAGAVIGCGPDTTHYIALGDSFAEGRGATDEERLDYVALFNQYYADDHSGPEQLTTYEQDGETSSSIIANQVFKAVQVIRGEETDVEVVTLTIGGNDFLPLVGEEPCASNPTGRECQTIVAIALTTFSVNYPAILGDLKAALDADPGEEQLLVTTYYNPYKGTGSPFELPADGILFGTDGTIDCAANATDFTKAGLNDMITCFAAAASATTVDLYPVISDRALTHTHIAEGTGDIHPNDSGYRLIADAIIAAYEAGK